MTISGLITIWFMLCGDLLFCIFLSHITTQFDLLSIRIKQLVYVSIDKQLIETYPLGKFLFFDLDFGNIVMGFNFSLIFYNGLGQNLQLLDHHTSFINEAFEAEEHRLPGKPTTTDNNGATITIYLFLRHLITRSAPFIVIFL